MNVYPGLEQASQNTLITEVSLGFFDGLHLGHQQVILGGRPPDQLKESAVVTFQNHPQSVLFKERPITLITGLPHKKQILKSWGINNLILLPFTLEISKKPADVFLSDLSLHLPCLKRVRVGANFRFGYMRQGDSTLLKAWGNRKGIGIDVIPSIMSGNAPVSSSRIRSHLNHRQLSEASALLGRSYSLFGRVIEGQKIGRTLGFPTANLSTEDGHLLPSGVYFGSAALEEDKSYTAAINIGRRPTIAHDLRPTVEAHLLDYNGDLYGQDIHLKFKGFLREERKFPSREELIRQLERDIQEARRLETAS